MYSWVVPILPYMDNQELFNQWTMFSTLSTNQGAPVAYFDPTNYIAGQASNAKISETAIGVLRCPDDNTIQINQGNLSYVVNGGAALWHAYPIGWIGGQIDGSPTPTSGPLNYVPSSMASLGWPATMGVTQKMGVMFLESTFGQGIPSTVRIPWNVRSTLNGIVDGASSTILMSENTLTGVSVSPSQYSLSLVTNWASPLPNFTSFFMPSNVCGNGQFPSSLDCTSGGLTPQGDIDGLGWAFANKVGTFTNINFGQNLTLEGSFPFSNSSHPGGCNMGFCDGAVRFIRNTIDGTVYSKIITPAGSKLPLYMKQMPVEQDAFIN